MLNDRQLFLRHQLVERLCFCPIQLLHTLPPGPPTPVAPMMATPPTVVALTDIVVDLGTSGLLLQRPLAHFHATPREVFSPQLEQSAVLASTDAADVSIYSCAGGRSEFCQRARPLDWRRRSGYLPWRCPHGRRGSGESTGSSGKRRGKQRETHGKEQGEKQRSKEQTLYRSPWMIMEMT